MDIKKIKELRDTTHVSLAKCKEALVIANGDLDDALVELQKMGVLKAKKASRREAREGTVKTYVHGDRVAVMVEVNCETDFTARNELFQQFAENLTLQIAAMHPVYLTSSEVPVDLDSKQREIFKAQVPENVPENKVDHVINGKMKKWYAEVCLLEQKSVVDNKGRTVEQCRADLVMQTGENIVIKRFVRWELGQ